MTASAETIIEETGDSSRDFILPEMAGHAGGCQTAPVPSLLILALVVALIFGAGAVPAMARRAGKGIRETRDVLGIDELREEIGGVRSSLASAPATGSSEGSVPTERVDSIGNASTGPAPTSGV